ncbi:integration host factor, actinobacterial type [Rhodococcus olei]|uniref:Integration host factor, actinobacterial type n=1 Tax=Rhodococcus olei TaxID=2161675 RepID=A0ABP8P6E6_9NOCA
MALPTLTPEQRAAALEKAAAARHARSELRASLKSGELTFADLLARADEDPVVGKTKVLYVLESLAGVGKIKAGEIAGEVGIPLTRRLAGLGARQREELLSRLA